MRLSETERFWAKVDQKGPIPEHRPDLGPCWLWTAAQYTNGYGQFALGGTPRRSKGAHRWAYEHLIGPVPDGLELDHLCRVRHCVNPGHLEPVTRSENLARSPLVGLHNASKMDCPSGHPLTGENLYIAPNGARHCRECKRLDKQARRERLLADPERLAQYRATDAERAHAYRSRQRGGHLATPNAEKTHCPKGHPLSGDNVYTPPSGGRKCRECNREACRRAHRRRMSLA